MNEEMSQLLNPKLRAALYVLVGLIFSGLGAWQAAEGNTLEALMLFLPTLQSALAVANTPYNGLLKGDTGEAGEPGADGEPGPAGFDGRDAEIDIDQLTAIVQNLIVAELANVQEE